MSLLIHTLPAETGDCFIVETDDKLCILIDAGFPTTYKDYLRPKLIELNNCEKVIDLFIITHIDQDHISGAIAFITENGYNSNPNIIPIKEIWFNGLKTICSSMEDSITLSQCEIYKLRDAVIKQIIKNGEYGKDDISVSEAVSFEQLCNKFGYLINTAFCHSVIIEKENAWIKPESNLSIDVYSPSKDRLDGLAKHIHKELYKITGKKSNPPADEFMQYVYECMLIGHDENLETANTPINDISYSDISQWINLDNKCNMNMTIPNLSSIAIVINYKGKLLVFPGDADIGFIFRKGIRPHLIKLSHHGSYQYNQKIIENWIECTYILSTNNKKFDHPSLSLIAGILTAKGKKHLHMNYAIDKLKLLSDKQQQQKYNFTVSIGDTLHLE